MLYASRRRNNADSGDVVKLKLKLKESRLMSTLRIIWLES